MGGEGKSQRARQISVPRLVFLVAPAVLLATAAVGWCEIRIDSFQVSASADDGYAWSATQQDVNSGQLMIGDDRVYTPPYYMSAMRFTNVAIPRNASVVEAHLKIRSVSEGFKGQIYGLIQAEATDAAADFNSRHIADTNKVTATIDWDHKFAWDKNTWQTSPDISSMVQEVVSRPGWSQSNSLAVFYSTRADSGKSRMFASFEAGAGALLEITYETYTISGSITTSEGSGLAGVTIFAGSDIEEGVTDTNGYYELLVPPGWSGAVTPNKPDWGLNPPSRTYLNLASDQTSQDYTAFQPLISGYVTDRNGSGVDAVMLSTDNGGGSDVTDANGYYELIVPYNWSGVVTVTKSGYKLVPESRSYVNVVSDQLNEDYVAFRPLISGHITDVNVNGTPMEGVLVSADNAGAAATTGADGYYEFTVPYNWSGAVTASKDGMDFEPQQRTYQNVVADQNDQDFTLKYCGGLGTEAEPYLICTAEHMQQIGAHPQDWPSHFRLVANIDLSDFNGLNGNPPFNLIGNQSTQFTGVFDGNGFEISNFTYDAKDQDSIALFRVVYYPSARIENLGLRNVNVHATGGYYTGSLAGYVLDATISNCYAEQGSVSGASYAGGLVGYNRGTMENCNTSVNVSGGGGVGSLVGYNRGTIRNSHATGDVSGGTSVGGLVGQNKASGSPGLIEDCSSTGNVSGSKQIGGLVGANPSGTVRWSFAVGTVQSSGWMAGGLVGWNNGTIQDSFSTGDVSGNGSFVGGLVGLNGSIEVYWSPNGKIERSHSTGNVFGSFYCVGGLVGNNWASTISGSYSVGDVNGIYEETGGLVGRNFGGKVFDCYSHGKVIGNRLVGGFIGRIDGSLNFPSGYVRRCYSTGQVTGASSVGGFTAFRYWTPVSHSFWDVNSSGISTSAAGSGRTTNQMQTRSTFTDAGWNFASVWAICEETNYPRFLWQIPLGDFLCPDGVDFADYSFFADFWQDADCADSNDCDGTDLDFSGAVNWADLRIFCDHLLEGK